MYVFESGDGINWSQKQKLTPADPGMNDWFGHSVFVQNTAIVVGSVFDDTLGTDSGNFTCRNTSVML